MEKTMRKHRLRDVAETKTHIPHLKELKDKTNQLDFIYVSENIKKKKLEVDFIKNLSDHAFITS